MEPLLAFQKLLCSERDIILTFVVAFFTQYDQLFVYLSVCLSVCL